VKEAAAPFPRRVHDAIGDEALQRALGGLESRFVANRTRAVDALPEFHSIRESARAMKDHALHHLDLYLQEYERKVVESGGIVHWAEDADAARAIVLDLCRKHGAKLVTKSKSMVTEEIDLAHHLAEHGITAVETDFGEYIIQLRGERPSHIVGPSIHLNREQIAETFRRVHIGRPADRDLGEAWKLLREAREELRQKFLMADVGITGANFLIAEDGSAVIVTNEGNADLTHGLPRVHIMVASIEKIVPTLEDSMQIMRLLARSTTGQDTTVYTTFVNGPKRPEDPDGPEEYHVVLVDNGRSRMMASDFIEALRCIRCGACMNHCPIYRTVGGHAYAATYPGPIGAVVMPALVGLKATRDLPNASTFCGRCEEVCPMQIPLPKLMRHWREEEFSQHLNPRTARWALRSWAFVAARPGLYRFATRIAVWVGGRLGRRGRFRRLPLAGGWTEYRDFPAPEGETFQSRWAKRRGG
jgi:L-lactate dehydrogenase complex protein LldF